VVGYLSVDQLLAESGEQTGLADLGAGDFRDGLAVGSSVEQIRSDYDFYIRHFDVALEG
jgi:hypothetical protein